MKRSELLRRYEDHLVFRNYSKRTSRSYRRALISFFDYCKSTSSSGLEVADYAKAFLTQLFNKGYSWSTVNIHYSAIKLFFTKVLLVEWNYDLLPRPKGRPSLPSVLSGKQVESIINVIKNLKHKTIVLLLYSTGIRISELIHLDISHLLIDRAQLKIVKGKGKKDRLVALSKTTLIMLDAYLNRYKPKTILFEGYPKSKRYSSSSVRKIIHRAAIKSGINFLPNAHSFRYAYATHHIELGTNLVALQYQLGHSSALTTIKYVKLCTHKTRHINHPVDLLKIHLPDKVI